jgi:hypothetical protein
MSCHSCPAPRTGSAIAELVTHNINMGQPNNHIASLHPVLRPILYVHLSSTRLQLMVRRRLGSYGSKRDILQYFGDGIQGDIQEAQRSKRANRFCHPFETIWEEQE